MLPVQSLFLNVLTLKPPFGIHEFSFYREKGKDLFPFQLKNVNRNQITDLRNSKNELPEKLYTNFTITAEADFLLKLEMEEFPALSVHYLRNLLCQYFVERHFVIQQGFTNELEVWINSPFEYHESYWVYEVYSLRIQWKRLSNYPELVVYFKGQSRILKTSVANLINVYQAVLTKVLFRNKILKFESLSEDGLHQLEVVYPVINKSMEEEFPGMAHNPFENRYPKLYDKINKFIDNYLNTNEFKTLIPICQTEFLCVPETRIFHIRPSSNLLQFSRLNPGSSTAYSPIGNLRRYGPYKLPDKPVKFISIFFEKDKDAANKLYLILSGLKDVNGKSYPDIQNDSLYSFVKIKYELEKDKSLKLTSESDPVTQLQVFLDATFFDTTKYNYLAFYISPVHKETEDARQQIWYYAIKELLLRYHITTQVVFLEKLFKPEFRKYYLLNIAAAVLAKTGGIPWTLSEKVKNGLVVGISAFKSLKTGVGYVGSAISFDNNGKLSEFDCVSNSETRWLAPKLKIMVQDFIANSENLTYLVIHFYKNMSQKELKPLEDMLSELGIGNLPVIIVSINKTNSSDYIAFDTNYTERMPFSGTIIQTDQREYLLFNNTRYENSVQGKVEGWPLPLKIHIRCSKKEVIQDTVIIKDLLDQVYQFSRLYYKSVKQQNLPVTLSYPELLARMVPWFENQNIGDFGKKSLWFI